jgi:rhodanese-related sulfurtransferase
MGWHVNCCVGTPTILPYAHAFISSDFSGGTQLYADPETIKRLAAGGRLIDVRSEAEYASCHIAGADNLPLQEFERHAARLAALPGTLVLTCQAGQRADKARQMLASYGGDAEILMVEGGTQGWRASGEPVNLGVKTVSIERQVRIAAGAMVAFGAAMTLLVSSNFVWLPLLVGTGLLVAGITDTCLMGEVLSQMPWNRTRRINAEAVVTRLESLCTS